MALTPVIEGCALTLLDERAVLELGVRPPQLVLRVHDDGPVPRHRLLDRLPRHEQEPDTGVACVDRHRVPAVEQHERPVLRFAGRAAPPPPPPPRRAPRSPPC